MKKIILSLAFVLVLAVMLAPVQAEPIIPDRDPDAVSYFTSDHASESLGTPPFGEVDLWQESGFVVVQASLYDDNKFVQTGGGNGSHDFFFNSTLAINAGDFVDLSGQLVLDTVDFTKSGIGYFEYGIIFDGQANGGAGAEAGPIVFQLNNNTIASLTVPNSEGNIFIADILSGETGATGLTDTDSTTTTVPEPSLILLLGLGLGGVSLVSRRKKS